MDDFNDWYRDQKEFESRYSWLNPQKKKTKKKTTKKKVTEKKNKMSSPTNNCPNCKNDSLQIIGTHGYRSIICVLCDYYEDSK